MRKSRSLQVMTATALCAVGLLLVSVVGGQAATAPKITRVSPLKLGVGDVLTIRGSNFVPGRNRNYVIFQRPRARAVFVKADTATKTKITLVIPAKLVPFLSRKGGASIFTRFNLRVLGRRLSPIYTRRSLSPLIGPLARGRQAPVAAADCVNGVPTGRSDDSDKDGLSDTLERQIHTDPCNADTDRDGVPDGYEYMAALDLNSKALPYPGKRPYPNPLDPTDANIDHDGDGMTMAEEYAGWVRYADSKFPLNMSDGTQNTGGVQSVPAGKEFLDLNGDGKLTDDERDIDNDNLSNWVEAHGPMVREWWLTPYKQEKLYSPAYPGVDWLDQDSDGDGVIDGLDDQDHDGWSNMSEVSRTTYWVNPYNPCLPDWKSPTCSLHPPPPEDSWPPFGTGDSGFVPADGSPPGTPLTCAANPARCAHG
jgi:hypothetical protein